MLAASEIGITQGTINSTFADNSTASATVLVPAWWSWPYPTGGDLVFPYRLNNESVDWNRSNIFQTSTWLDSSKEIISIQLPNVTGGAATDPGGAAIESRLHIFALTLVPAAEKADGPVLSVQYARSTQKWVEGSNKTQIYEVLVSNAGTGQILRNHSVTASVESEGVKTVQAGYIKRLGAGDQTRVNVEVENLEGVESGTVGPATVIINGEGIDTVSYTFNASFGLKPYEATYDSIYAHDSPDWFDNGKYGIFIHWGVYAVPAWGNSGKNESYAEWYWWHLNDPEDKSQTYQHHLATYGPDVVYDDFIQNFTAAKFEPKDWVDLFADAGANYFVQVSKHHDGYAIFDLPANVSDRTSVKLMPHRNLLQDIFDAADQYQPHLHKATYYSLPEWFHPDYKGFADWPGGNATNPFTNVTLPYTGYVPVSDYVNDIVLPEMRALAAMGTEVMWCDIGGPNRTTEFAAAWYNALAAENKQALMNARCGLPGDFDTPEYARYASVQARKWETSQGMDPYSYGYNAATPLDEYMNASTIVKSLVDIVSKNGNFLLDVGPKADGTILPVMQDNLREAGKWIKSHGEAVFNTTYWHVTPQEGEHVRFTTSKDAFYVLVMEKPEQEVVLRSPVPWVEGDQVRVVGGSKPGEVVPSSRDQDGGIVLRVSEDVASADEFVWIFAIDY
ncbi:glycoside hydrolase superfamily [Paraphoma chrysanthemicola]|uniref:alpha-L-fucosidase n=1 Tax=Paraphoma chrysanthemicola TaxID=798071 RepID=A0A8K0VW65_9PLEO|nr:glycoside hydrolase superfamily [Paraphoma chrysanthemicola]